MKPLLISVTTFLLMLLSLNLDAQYIFTEIKNNPATSVKNQAKTGTCWCFATVSFLESDLMRQGKGEHNLSEMFIVRQNYRNRLEDNFIRKGKGNISEGSLSHMAIKSISETGLIPEKAYNGINYGLKSHNHAELSAYLEAVAEKSVKLVKRSPEYYKLIESIFDIYLGEVPEKFTYQNKEYTPISFMESLELDLNDYVELTSFNHHPFYEQIPFEVPDNWDHEKMYNLPLDDLMDVMNYAINNGHTIVWDGDVSEKGFSTIKGIAINPVNKKLERKDLMKLTEIIPEEKVNQENRQKGFENFTTTDDHLMHITGLSKDQNGRTYYITKNSYGPKRGEYEGYLHMSENYVRLKTTAIMVHKDAIPKSIKKKLNIK